MKGGELMSSNISLIISQTFNRTLFSVVNYIPNLISGIIVLLLGIIIGSFLKQITIELFKLLKLETILKKYGVPEAEGELNWGSILSEIVKWFIVILFLIPAADIWGLEKFVEVLNNLLSFLPKVFVAIAILLLGLVISKLVHDMLFGSTRELSPNFAKSISMVGRWTVMVFVVLIILNQLGITPDLINILFAGFVAMVALAGGLAFGLGGKEAAKEILGKMMKKL